MTVSKGKPYPVSLPPHRVPKTIPPGGGVETFDTPEAQAINHARMEHLDTLGLLIEGRRVLDVGAGVGHLAQYFLRKGCEVVCVDAREENIASMAGRYPGLKGVVLDVETEPLARLGRFEVVFCYGLFYHLENPLAAVRDMASVCDALLLLETVVTDHHLPLLQLDEETFTLSQALRGLGCRPSPSYVVLAITAAGFDYIYGPTRPPDHEDFQFAWKNDLAFSRDGHLLRCIFVGSRTPLASPHLVQLNGSVR